MWVRNVAVALVVAMLMAQPAAAEGCEDECPPEGSGEPSGEPGTGNETGAASGNETQPPTQQSGTGVCRVVAWDGRYPVTPDPDGCLIDAVYDVIYLVNKLV